MTLLEAKEIDKESILQIKSKLKEFGIGVPIVAEKEEEAIICKKEALLNNPDGIQEGRYVYRISMEAYPRRCQAFVAYEVKDGEFIFKNKIIAEDRIQYPFSKEGLNKLLDSNKLFKLGQLREGVITVVIDLLLADGVDTDGASPEFVARFADSRGIILSINEVVAISNRYENPSHPAGEWEREWSNERKQNPPTDFYGNEIEVGDEVKDIKFWSGPKIIIKIEDGNYNGEPNNYKIWTKLKDSESDTERFTYSHYVEKVEPEIKIKPLEKFGLRSITSIKDHYRDIKELERAVEDEAYDASLDYLFVNGEKFRMVEYSRDTTSYQDVDSVSRYITYVDEKTGKTTEIFMDLLYGMIDMRSAVVDWASTAGVWVSDLSDSETEPEIKIKPLDKFGEARIGQVSVKDTNGKEIHIGDEVREVGGGHRGIVRHIGPLKRRDGSISGHDKSVWSNWSGEPTEGVGINGFTYMSGMELVVVEPQGLEIKPLEIFGRRLSRVTPQIRYNKTEEVMDPKISHGSNKSWKYRQEKEDRKEEYAVGDKIAFYSGGKVMKGEVEGKERDIYSIVTGDRRSIVPRLAIKGRMIRNAY